MIVDFHQVDDQTGFEADVCIIGAGVAGITLARALDPRLQVILVESGGEALDGATQALYEGTSVGLPYYPLDVARLRYLGGSSNHWNGWCTPLTALDLGPRPWVGLERGWPIGLDDLLPHYQAAQPILELGPYAYGAEVWNQVDGAPWPLGSDELEHRFWQFSAPTRMGTRYRADLAADHVTTLLHANAVGFDCSADGGHVERVRLRALSGIAGTVTARITVLASGGIEVPRLLLAADDVHPAGLGNQHDQVGRCFMEHLEARAATLSFAPGQADGFVDAHTINDGHGFRAQPGIFPSAAFQRAEGVLDLALTLEFTIDAALDGTLQLRRIGRDLAAGQIPDAFGSGLWSIVSDAPNVVGNLYRLYVAGRGRVPSPKALEGFAVAVHAEQSPNPGSRVRLGHERDSLGMRRVELDWRVTPLDKRSVQATLLAFARAFGRQGTGRVQLEAWLTNDDLEDWGPTFHGGYHHMGTARMADDPRHGVVDRDCRVHGVDNLHVAGSAVFPTGGAANPTLTIVALTLRLADHLSQELRRDQR